LPFLELFLPQKWPVCGLGLVWLVVVRKPTVAVRRKKMTLGRAGYIFVDFCGIFHFSLQLYLRCRVAMETQPYSMADLFSHEWLQEGIVIVKAAM
jgi:hypothetical protein